MARPKKLKLPKHLYAAIRKADAQVLGTGTNRRELEDRVNTDTPNGEFTVAVYIPEVVLLQERVRAQTSV